jgi:hypothetical protein
MTLTPTFGAAPEVVDGITGCLANHRHFFPALDAIVGGLALVNASSGPFHFARSNLLVSHKLEEVIHSSALLGLGGCITPLSWGTTRRIWLII